MKDPVKQREAQARYRARNREKRRAYLAEYRKRPGAKQRDLELKKVRYHASRVGVPRKLKQACKFGHALSGDNLVMIGRRRVCRTCKIETHRRFRAGRKPGESTAIKQAWREKNRERDRAISALHRARKRGATGRYSYDDLQAQYAKQEGLCYYCAVPLNGKYDAEHKTPVSRGGTNLPENIVCACRSCNLRKATLTAEEFLAKCKSLVEAIPHAA